MTGMPHHEDVAERERESRAAAAVLDQPAPDDSVEYGTSTLVAQVMRKRKLYNHLTGTEVPWFPHDNDMELVKDESSFILI